MTLTDLIAVFRLRAEDGVEPYLWSSPEITIYLNEAEKEACERALLIQDSTTPAVCNLSLTAGTAMYPLHASVLNIMYANIGSEFKPLVVTTRDAIKSMWPDWATRTGTPKFLFEDGEGNVVVVPNPVVNDIVRITVKRLPINQLSADGDSPEIEEKHHYRMIDWALRCAYLKPDADAEDKGKASGFENEFERSFGYRNDANVTRKQRYQTTHTTKSSW